MVLNHVILNLFYTRNNYYQLSLTYTDTDSYQ